MNRARPSATPWIVLVVLLLLVLGARTVLYTVNERENAVILQFGRPVASRTEPGLYFKLPFVQEVRRLPKTLQYWRSTKDEELVDLPTADGKKIEVSIWAVWRITDPGRFVEVLRTTERAESQVKLRVRAAIRDVITAHNLSEVVRSTDRELQYSFQLEATSGQGAVGRQLPVEIAPVQPGAVVQVTVGRERIMALARERVQRELEDTAEGAPAGRGIELVDVGIYNISFVKTVQEAAFKRLTAFMESIAAGYYNAGVQRKQEILNETNAEVEKILGEGAQQASIIRGQVDAENISKYAQAIEESGEFYNFIRTLEVYTEAFGGETRLILTTDSDLLRLLKDGQRAVAPVDAAPH